MLQYVFLSLNKFNKLYAIICNIVLGIGIYNSALANKTLIKSI